MLEKCHIVIDRPEQTSVLSATDLNRQVYKMLQNAGIMGISTVCITGSILLTLTLPFQDNLNIISNHLSLFKPDMCYTVCGTPALVHNGPE